MSADGSTEQVLALRARHLNDNDKEPTEAGTSGNNMPIEAVCPLPFRDGNVGGDVPRRPGEMPRHGHRTWRTGSRGSRCVCYYDYHNQPLFSAVSPGPDSSQEHTNNIK